MPACAQRTIPRTGPTPTMSIASSVPGATGDVAFDQRAHRRNVAQPELDRVAADDRHRAAHQPVARFAGAGEAVGLDGRVVGDLARGLGRARLAEDIALDHADAELADQLQIVVGLDALRAGIHVERLGERDDGADDRRVAVGGADDAAPRTKLWSILILSNGAFFK